MAVRVGQTRGGASRLLRTVRGKPHAQAGDHEQVQQKEDTPQEGLSLEEQRELGLLNDNDDDDDDAINAEPVTSDDEPSSTPLISSKPTTDSNALRPPPGSSRKRKAEASLPAPEPESELELKKPTRTNTRTAAPRVPKRGQYEQSRAAKEGLEGNKENATAQQTPPTSSHDKDVWGFGMSTQNSQKLPKVTFGGQKTKNIHARHAQKKTFGKSAKTKGKQSHTWDVKAGDDGSDSEVSMLSEPMDDGELNELGVLVEQQEQKTEESQDPELRKIEPRKKRARADVKVESPGLNDAELDAMLKPTLREQLGLTDAPDTPLPPSSAPQEDMDNIDSYMRELPAEAEEGTSCPICNEPIDQESYWEFWKSRKKTVKNQAAFCHDHKKAAAQKEYTAEGFPAIDWSQIPDRIKKHRMSLHKILTADHPSTYRTRYEPLALTGKAAAVPSKRTDLSPSAQTKLASYALDSHFVYPGYYGPHGRRLITESIMSLLSAEIKRCTDPVVQASGPATFVQAVLVPEASVRLIMEDLLCDWEAAEDVRERTWEMGVLLHEEVEDEVLVSEGESECENDYLH